MQIEIEEQEAPVDLERKMESVIESFSQLSKFIIEGDLTQTESSSLDLKQKLAELEQNVEKMGGDLKEEEELDAQISRYEKENAEMNEKVRKLEEKSQKAEKLLKEILSG